MTVWAAGGGLLLLPRTLMMIRCVSQQPDCTQFTRLAHGASIHPSGPLCDDTETLTPSSTHPHRRNISSNVASLSQSAGLRGPPCISIFMKTSIIRHLVLSQRAKTIQTAAGLSQTWSRSPPAASVCHYHVQTRIGSTQSKSLCLKASSMSLAYPWAPPDKWQ